MFLSLHQFVILILAVLFIIFPAIPQFIIITQVILVLPFEFHIILESISTTHFPNLTNFFILSLLFPNLLIFQFPPSLFSHLVLPCLSLLFHFPIIHGLIEQFFLPSIAFTAVIQVDFQ